MGTPKYNWKGDEGDEALERQLAILKLQCDEDRRRQREMQLEKSNIFYPFPSPPAPVPQPLPSTSTMPEPFDKIPKIDFTSGSFTQLSSGSSLLSADDGNKKQVRFRYDVDELKFIASKMQFNVLLKGNIKKNLFPGPIPYLRNAPSAPIRKNGLYRCVPGLEKPEPLNDVLNKLQPATKRFRMIRKTSNLRILPMSEEEELENMYHHEEP